MTQLEIFTFGGGDILVQVFNAIASLLKPEDSALRGLFRLAILFGGIWVLVESIFKRNYFLNFKWWISYFVVTFLLLSPSASVIIHDKLSHKLTPVENVPLGLAILGHYTSLIGVTLTTSLDTTFRLADDASNLSYTNSGFLMFSKMAEASTDFQISDPAFLQNIESFVKQCVFYDLLLNRYTITDLKQQKNLWQFLSGNASRARAYMHNGEIIGCSEGVNQLSHQWENEVETSLGRYAKQLFSISDAKQSSALTSLFESNLTSTYSYLMGASESATNIMRQNMMINAMHSAMRGYAAETGSVAAMQNIDYLQAQTHKRRTNHTIGRMAEHWLPIMHVVFEAMIYGSFVLIALLAFMPFGFNILKNYVFSLMWLQSWAPLYAILNLVMAVYAQHQLAGLGSADNDSSLYLNYANHSQFGQIQADISSLAGYLSISIPFIAMGLVRGMSSVFTQLAQYIGGVTQSAAIGAASEATSGNYSMGNLSFQNQNMHNLSGYKHDANSAFADGQFVHRAMHGTEFKTSAGGYTSINSRGAISQLTNSFNLNESIRTSSSQQAETALSAAYSNSHSASEHYSSTVSELLEFNETHGLNETYNSNSNLASTGGYQTAANQLNSNTQLTEVADNKLDTDTDRKSKSMYGGASAQVGFDSSKLSGLGKIAKKLGLSAGVTVDGGFKADKTLSTEHQNTTIDSFINRWSDDSNYSATVEHGLRAAVDYAYNHGDEHAQREIDQIASHYDEAKSYRDEASRQLHESHSYRDLHQISMDKSFNANTDISQQFVDWAQERYGYTAQQIDYMDVHESDELQHKAQQFIAEKTDEYIQHYKTQHDIDSNNISEQYSQSNTSASSIANVVSNHENINERVQNEIYGSNIKKNIKDEISDAAHAVIENTRGDSKHE